MQGRKTDHKNLDMAKLHLDVIKGKANGMILWQPRIDCWHWDKKFKNEKLPEPYEGLTMPEIYSMPNCSARTYEYRNCYKRIEDPRVRNYTNKLSEMELEDVIETPIGKLTVVHELTPNSPRMIKKKWLISCEEDMRVAMWLEENSTYEWDEELYQKMLAEWGHTGAPTMFMPRVNLQHLYINVMGVEEATYALCDYTKTVEKYFQALDENHHRLIELINQSPIDIINFGDNLHVGTTSPSLFQKYILPSYLRRNELLHKAGKFTHSHWDGDTKGLLPFAKECGLDGIEAITPIPQGDVTVKEIKAALGDELFLIDGIAAILFDQISPIEHLESQVNELIELFGSKIILGISDEMSSTGDIERFKVIERIVDDYNATYASNYRQV